MRISVIVTDVLGLSAEHPLVREAVDLLLKQINAADHGDFSPGKRALRISWEFESAQEVG
jgi:hypothetical protein